MRPRGSVLTAIVALLAIGFAFAAPANLAAERAQVVIEIPASHASAAVAHAAVAAIDRSERLWGEFRRWVFESYERAPALVLGLAALLVLPPLAMVGLLLRWSSSGSRIAQAPSLDREDHRESMTEAVFQWPAEAWIEVEGTDKRHPLGRGMLRIGREEDNDLQLLLKTVHRYHAVIHRTPDAYYVITDLSSAEGNGVIVNGTRISEARLRDGDTVQLGEAVLRFSAQAA